MCSHRVTSQDIKPKIDIIILIRRQRNFLLLEQRLKSLELLFTLEVVEFPCIIHIPGIENHSLNEIVFGDVTVKGISPNYFPIRKSTEFSN
jgi:hypothetical protein